MDSLTQIKAITFDVGGTLLQPWPSVGEIYAEVMSRHGLCHTPEQLEANFARVWVAAQDIPRELHDADGEKRWWREVVHRVIVDLGVPDDFDRLFDDLWTTFADPRRWQLYDGATETLDALRNAGYRLAVLSNWDMRLRPLLTGMQLDTWFETMIISAEVGVEKPDSAIFQLAEERLELTAGQILHVGDSEHHDRAGAEGAGWPVFLVDPARMNRSTTHVQGLPGLLDRLPLVTNCTMGTLND